MADELSRESANFIPLGRLPFIFWPIQKRMTFINAHFYWLHLKSALFAECTDISVSAMVNLLH